MERWILIAIASSGFVAGQGEFLPANLANDRGTDELRLFPSDNPATVIKIPFLVSRAKFGGDGHSLYASIRSVPSAISEPMSGLVRIAFNPVRYASVPGTEGFAIRDFAVTPDHHKIVISGHRRTGSLEQCGLFEITDSGVVRLVRADDCSYLWSWTDLSISPDGNKAIANYGNTHTDHNYRMDLIDLAHGTSKSIGDLSRAAWSPDGKWIAAIEWERRRLILLEANDLSHRRDLGSTVSASWSPDSRYLLVWTWHFLRCGIGIDVEPPASFEILEVATGKRSLVRSSQCRLVTGLIGWLSKDAR